VLAVALRSRPIRYRQLLLYIQSHFTSGEHDKPPRNGIMFHGGFVCVIVVCLSVLKSVKKKKKKKLKKIDSL